MSQQGAFLGHAKEAIDGWKSQVAEKVGSHERSVGALTAPLEAQIVAMSAKGDAIESARTSSYASLQTQIDALLAAEGELKDATVKLRQTIQSPGQRGQWGELQLRNCVEKAGMQAGCDFVTQQPLAVQTDSAGSGATLRPDMIVNLPNDGKIIVDAKVPMSSFIKAMEEEEGPAHTALMKAHCRAVHTHVSQLSAKEYWQSVDVESPEYVVMYLPSEALLSKALRHDPSLLDFAAGKNVFLSSPITLILLLRTAATVWQQKRAVDGVTAIIDLAQTFYYRLQAHGRHVGKMGKDLTRVVDQYNTTVRSFDSRVGVSAQRLQELGAARAAAGDDDAAYVKGVWQRPGAPAFVATSDDLVEETATKAVSVAEAEAIAEGNSSTPAAAKKV